ncbi:MAG TPA: type II toxin-antitoxin system VapC family toxin [Rhizomicrobium sp.]
MRGLDTNVLIRFLLADDPAQTRAATKIIQDAVAAGEVLLVSLLTVLELEWVLRASVGMDKNAILRTFKMLLEARELLFDQEAVLEQALYDFEHFTADFADCLMLASYRAARCETMLTFDIKAAKLPGAELVRT